VSNLEVSRNSTSVRGILNTKELKVKFVTVGQEGKEE
jgi:hypothetical protein